MGSEATTVACPLCDVTKSDQVTMTDHVRTVHPEEFCTLYHYQPCYFDRRERYMDAMCGNASFGGLEDMDQALVSEAAIRMADAEILYVIRFLADMIDGNSRIVTAVQSTDEIRKVARDLVAQQKEAT